MVREVVDRDDFARAAPQRLEGPVTVPRTHVEHAPPREVFRHPVNVGIQGIRARRDDAVGQLDAVIPERMGVDAPSQIHCLHARSEEHTSELQSLLRISYAVFCLNKKNTHNTQTSYLATMHTIHRETYCSTHES